METLTRRWRRLGVWVPVAFVAAVAVVAVLGLGSVLSDVGIVFFIVAVCAVGAFAFSSWMFRVLLRTQRETDRRARYLAAINEASLSLSSELDLSTLLQRVVDLSREVTSARYGALAILGEDGTIVEFFTSGITAKERQRIGRLPQGQGLLGAVIREGKTVRVDRIDADPRSAGFPPYHPLMTSFIGLPIIYENQVVGDLYLTVKEGGAPFTQQDEELLRAFAAHAGMAIENARLYRQVQDLAVLEERDRIGMDLHDGVIQSLYAAGLTLENSLEDLAEDPAQVRPQLEKAIHDLNQIIVDIRSYIFSLRPAVLADTDLAGAVGGLLQELKVNALLDVELIEMPEACKELSQEEISTLFHVAQESLTNVRKHAHASSVTALLERRNGAFRMSISDDGRGFDPTRPGGGQGLRNMRERVETIGGQLGVQSGNGKGTQLIIELPVMREREA